MFCHHCIHLVMSMIMIMIAEHQRLIQFFACQKGQSGVFFVFFVP